MARGLRFCSCMVTSAFALMLHHLLWDEIDDMHGREKVTTWGAEGTKHPEKLMKSFMDDP